MDETAWALSDTETTGLGEGKVARNKERVRNPILRMALMGFRQQEP
jgi:hypothetical protein